MGQDTLGYVELFWVCPNCNGKNPGTQRTCQSCGSPQPQDIKFQQDTHAELLQDQEKIEKAKAGADIHCGFCGARNPASAKICSQCGGDISQGKQRESGQVVGAFTPGQVAQVPCPTCGMMNPENALKCSQCGASFSGAGEVDTSGKAALDSVPRKPGPVLTIAGIILALILFGICGWMAMGYFKTQGVQGTVSKVDWTRTIDILALGPVQKEGWKNEISAEASVGNCASRFHYESDSAPASAEATKVCGTPYTIDKGSGVGQVVTDCTYQVYDQYCQFTVDEWHKVDAISLSGNDLNAAWPSPPNATDRRIGDKTEVYNVFFETSGGNFDYSVSSYDQFMKFTPGSRWTLNINQFNTILSVEESK